MTKTREPDAVERFIALIREIDPVYMVDLFTNGGCFHLYRIVKAAFPSAEAWWTPYPGHVWIKVGRYWYDIDKRRTRAPREAERIPAEDPGEHHDWLRDRLLCQYAVQMRGSHWRCTPLSHNLPSHKMAMRATGSSPSTPARTPRNPPSVP